MNTLDDYEVISVIGNGSFGTCFKVKDKITNKIYAWKAINYENFDDEDEKTTLNKKEILDSEIGFLQQLKHPNIVQYYDHICNIETKTIFIIMEYCDGGDLQNLIKKCQKENLKFEEKYIWKVLYQISKALQLCHNKISEGCILHRDIKPANIFLDKYGNAKLGDFGLARILKRNQQNFAESFVGSPYYMSPEIVKGRKYDKKSDMWAVGCLIYEMCSMKPPFKGKRFEQLSDHISSGNFDPIPNYYSKDLQEIISFMLEVDSEQRPNVEILLRHPVFIRNLNELKDEFPKLLPRSPNKDDISSTQQLGGAKKILFSPNLSSNKDTNNFTFSDITVGNIEEFTGRITGVNTPQLRAELFNSSIKSTITRTSSYPDLNSTVIYNERIYANSIVTSNKWIFNERDHRNRCDDPQLLTRDIFDETLKQRLQIIRAQEAILKQRENCLMEKERQLIERERRLTNLEKDLEDKKQHIEGMLKRVAFEKRSSARRLPKRRISKTLDESYCTIDPNECSIAPTVAKLELNLMPPPSAMIKNSNLKKSVTFSSPKKIFKANVENVPGPPTQLAPPQPPSVKTLKQITSSLKDSTNLQSSLSSKTSNESDGTTSTSKPPGKRRSFLSIFGLSGSHKNKANNEAINNENNLKEIKECIEKQSNLNIKQTQSLQVIDKVNSENINQIWTKENKKAAFEMLAAMNAADKESDILKNSCSNFVNSQRNSYVRRTARERGTSLNRSSKLRRSAVYLPSPNNSGNRIIL